MNNYEYTNELFKKVCEVLGIKFTKTTATKLQLWATENQPPFMGLVDMRAGTAVTVGSNIVTYQCTAILIVASNIDPTDQEVYENHSLSQELWGKFQKLVRTNRYCDIEEMILEEVFRFDT